MTDLNDRQNQILKTVILEYIDTAEAVGSETLDRKYNLGISPATIRNEMVRLTEMGYLKQPHTSAGRTPTPLALRYFVNNLMQVKQLPVSEEMAVKEKIWDCRHEVDKLLQISTRTLAQRTKTLAISTTDEGEIYYAGVAQMLDMTEFYDIDLTKMVLQLLDQFDYWQALLARAIKREEHINVYLGEEFGRAHFDALGGVFTWFHLPGEHQAVIGVIGPKRLNYPYVIPVVRYVGELLDDMVGKW